MGQQTDNRFQDFFEEDKYIFLKNELYNYLLRKRAIEKSIQTQAVELALEVGSGISPVMTKTSRIIYSDLSLTALQILKRTLSNGSHVVADGMNLPFKSGVFSHSICSEVLEHLENDRKALKELARVMMPSGQLLVTFPHRKFYFTNDDRFVNHYRRYEIEEMEDRLHASGLKSLTVQKILGPLEKLTMSLVVYCFSILQKGEKNRAEKTPKNKRMNVLALIFKWANRFYMGVVWLDAKIMPLAISTVLLIKAEKKQQTEPGSNCHV
jgi:SAM-dependent methyltransferase